MSSLRSPRSFAAPPPAFPRISWKDFAKRTKPDKLRFYNTAQASADECLYQLILAHDLRYADTTTLQADLEEVSRLLQGYINGLERGS